MKRFFLPLSALLLVITCAACASTSENAPARRMDVITRAEIEATGPYVNALDVVRRLRPQWLRAGGQYSINASSYIAVYRNNMRMGSIGALEEINADIIVKMKHLGSIEASSRFGMNNLKGAIVVITG